jgi:hypothetical protein
LGNKFSKKNNKIFELKKLFFRQLLETKMGKKIQKKPVSTPAEPLKKKIKRQNTMEVTAAEGKAIISALDK